MNINSVVEEVSNLAPYILIVGSVMNATQAFLVTDKKIISEISCFEDIPFSLMSAFFVYNIQYPVGCSNFYAFMEIITLYKRHQ